MGTHNIPFSLYKKQKITLNYPKLQLWDFFHGTQGPVRSSPKRAISVRATEVLLYRDENGLNVNI